MILTVPIDEKFYPTLGPQVCDFIEQNLVFGPGDLRGRPAILDDEKRAFVYRMYEVFPKKHRFAGRRRFKRVGLSLRKGTAKTELAAWIAACELHPEAPVRCSGFTRKGEPIGGPVSDPYIPLVAYTEEQSEDLAYGSLRVILELSTLKDDFVIGLERIERKKGDGKAVPLAAAPDARDGARTTFQHFDEVHRFTQPRLVRAHKTMLANIPKRRLADPWTLETTTAPEPGTGSVAEGTMEYARKVAAGLIQDAQLFYFHRQASETADISTDEGLRAAIEEASGPSIEWSDVESIRGQFNDPDADIAYLDRVWLNRLVQSTRQAFNVVKWKQLTKPRAVPKKTRIAVGFDGAQFNDSTAIVAVDILTGYMWLVRIWERPATWPADKVWQVPAEEVDEAMRQLFADYDVWRLYADPPYWQSWIARWRGDFGEERVIEWWTNRRRQMSAALENFETAFNGDLEHDDSAELARHIGNARRKDIGTDDQGKTVWLIQKDRPDSPFKIDAAMAATLCWEARTDALAAGVAKAKAPRRGPKVWTPEGFIAVGGTDAADAQQTT